MTFNANSVSPDVSERQQVGYTVGGRYKYFAKKKCKIRVIETVKKKKEKRKKVIEKKKNVAITVKNKFTLEADGRDKVKVVYIVMCTSL